MINQEDHEDAFKSANQCAGRLTDMVTELQACDSKERFAIIVLDLQKWYGKLFDAFIEGVAYGRDNPLCDPKTMPDEIPF